MSIVTGNYPRRPSVRPSIRDHRNSPASLPKASIGEDKRVEPRYYGPCSQELLKLGSQTGMGRNGVNVMKFLQLCRITEL